MYITDISVQLKNIMPALGLGFVLGLLYEALRILRLYIHSGKVFVFVTDILFTVFSSVSAFLLCVSVDNGHIRFYIVLACILGYVVCIFTAGELIYALFARIHCAVMKILTPLFKPFVFVWGKLCYLMKKVPENAEKIKNKFKNLLKHGDKVVYNKRD